MKTQTSLVAKQVRLQSWADQIQECQNRPVSMSVDAWCDQHGVTKANYYYRLRKVREACLDAMSREEPNNFVELPVPSTERLNNQGIDCSNHSAKNTVAVLHGRNEVKVEVFQDISPVLLSSIIEALGNAK